MNIDNIFITADQHFGHSNIIKYESRPFLNAEDMDRVLIKNWNTVVSNKDTIIIAGDISFHNKEKTTEIINQLNGKKILVKGNHDKRNNRWWMDVGIDTVSSFPIIFNDYFVIQHEPPAYYNDACPYFYIYGHVHGSEMYKTITKKTACVSVERWEYRPVELEKIIELSKLA